MSNAPQNPNPRRKLFVAAVLLLILVVFPVGSYLYLKGGLNWRRQAMAELGAFGQVRPVYIIFPGNDREDRIAGKVCVLHMFGENPDLTDANRRILDLGESLFQQFGQNDAFRYVLISQGGTTDFKSYAQTRPSSEYATWVWSGALGSWSTILLNGYDKYCVERGIKPEPEYFGLTDTSGIIRRFYNVNDQKDVDRMVQQIALLLPK